MIEVTCTTSQLKAPTPFNLGDLQREAYRVFKFSPSYTLTLAEKLYLNGLISYPRTSSQKLSPSIDYKKIILSISELSLSLPYDDSDNKKYNGSVCHSIYKSLAVSLLSERSLSPNQGSKTDPAHPAIYPTGERPKVRLEKADFKIFDLIIKRFFATFGKPALSRLITATIQVKNDYLFRADSKKTIDEGWLPYYRPYNSLTNTGSEKELLNLRNSDSLQNISITIAEKFSQPPPRFNQATLLEQMEKDNIGTKATRSDVISTLFKRNYISNINAPRLEKTTEQPRQTGALGIVATELGLEIIQSMRSYVPEIISSDLTRFTEAQLYQIESGTMRSANVLKSAIDRLNEALVYLKKKEKEIGDRLTEAITMTRLQQQQRQHRQTTLGACPVCRDGLLRIIRSSRTKKRFIGCSNYTSGKCKAAAACRRLDHY